MVYSFISYNECIYIYEMHETYEITDFTINPIDFSLKQNIIRLVRQAFIGLINLVMICFRETSIGLIAKQNEISTQTDHCFPVKSLPPKVYKMLTFVHDDDDNDNGHDSAATDINTRNDNMYKAIALA